ncbi:MAG: S49 family peptidase, partial [Bacteroidales bacterium]|nr:S49 family peptidase [Bacteroidales bacterium]
MSNFTKTVLAVIVGMLIISILPWIFWLIFIGIIAAGTSSTGNVNSPGILKLDLSTTSITEQVKEDFTYSTGAGAQYSKTIGLWDAVNAINVAAEDPNIKHIYLKTDGNVNSMATCEEIRTALDNFRKSGKGVIAYIESPGTLGYYVASVSDKIYMGRYHGGNINFNGVGGRMIFLKDLLDKFGVNMQLIRHGKYKSAGEMFIRNSSSPENREQNERMVVSMWETMRKTISEARNIPEERLDAAIDNLELCLPEDFLNAGLVDELVGRPELENHIAVLDVKDDIKDVNLINFAAYAEAKAELNLRSK